MGNYAKKAVYGASIIFFMNILAAVISYITRIVLARELGPYNYGLFYSVFTFVAFFLFFRDLGLNTALVKHIPEFAVLLPKPRHNVETTLLDPIHRVEHTTLHILGQKHQINQHHRQFQGDQNSHLGYIPHRF